MDQSDINSTDYASDDVDVEEFFLGTNWTVVANETALNATIGNSTFTNRSSISFPDLMTSPACLKYRNNPFWRLTSTRKMVIEYMCVCYGMCYSDEYWEDLHRLASANRTEKNVFQKNPFFMFYLTFVLYLAMALFGTTGK